MLFNNFDGKTTNNLNEKYIKDKIKPFSSHLSFKKIPFLYQNSDFIFFNMSLSYYKKDLWFAVRSGLKRLGKDYWNEEFTNGVYVGKIKGKKINLWEVNVQIDSINNGRLGAEDPRIFEHEGRLLFSADIPLHFVKKKQLNAIFDIEGNNIKIFNDPLKRNMSKNWMPYSSGEDLYLITDVLPTRIINANTGKVIIYNKNNNVPAVSGGGKIIEIDGIKTSLVHGKMPGDDKVRLKYWHAIAQWNDNWRVRISDPFYFERLGIEFSTGFEVVDDKIFISYSVDDDGVNLFSVNLEKFKETKLWRMDV